MKMAKIFAIFFALVLAVFCLNGPFAFGGDEHPWDEEGGGGINGGGYTAVPPSNDGGTLSTGSSSADTVTLKDDSALLLFWEITITFSTII